MQRIHYQNDKTDNILISSTIISWLLSSSFECIAVFLDILEARISKIFSENCSTSWFCFQKSEYGFGIIYHQNGIITCQKSDCLQYD